MKVELDIKKPLPRGKKVYTADWKPIWVSFRYEKLPILYHYCGVVGHDDRACMVKHQDAKDGTVKENQYDGWLKASPTKLPPRRRAEDQPDFSSAESSAERNNFRKADDRGNDLNDQRKSGVFENRKRQLLWDSNKEENGNKISTVGKEGSSQLLMCTIPKKRIGPYQSPLCQRLDREWCYNLWPTLKGL